MPDPVSIDVARYALLGTVVGAFAVGLGSVVANVITNRAATRRSILELGYKCAIEEMNHQKLVAPVGIEILPPISYVHFNVELLRRLEKGELDAAAYADVVKRRDRLTAAIREAHRTRV